MLLVRATENSTRQTESAIEMWWKCGVIRRPFIPSTATRSPLERGTIKGDSPVEEPVRMIGAVLEYCPLDIGQEFGRHQLPTLNTF